MWQIQVGDWEEAVAKFKTSQAEESLALASKEASIENRAMSLAEGHHLHLYLLPPHAHLKSPSSDCPAPALALHISGRGNTHELAFCEL